MLAEIIVLYFVCISAYKSLGGTCFYVQGTTFISLGFQWNISLLSQPILDPSLGRGVQCFLRFVQKKKKLLNFLNVTKNSHSGSRLSQLPSFLSVIAAIRFPLAQTPVPLILAFLETMDHISEQSLPGPTLYFKHEASLNAQTQNNEPRVAKYIHFLERSSFLLAVASFPHIKLAFLLCHQQVSFLSIFLTTSVPPKIQTVLSDIFHQKSHDIFGFLVFLWYYIIIFILQIR